MSPVFFKNQNYSEIKKTQLGAGKLFVDPEFPPDVSSIFLHPSGRQDPIVPVLWMRPHEIVDNPRLFVEGISSTDVIQGRLGNCWFVAACSALTHHDKMFRKVIRGSEEQEIDPSHPGKYCGIFHFTFWRMGRWTNVVVDDLLPTENGRLIFAHSKSRNEFWSALLEKAIAKLNGCYEALTAGSLAEALVDLSGGIPEKIDLQKPIYRGNQERLLEVFNNLKDAFDKKSLIAAAIAVTNFNEIEVQLDCGLVKGHSYAITAVKNLELLAKKKNNSSFLDLFKTPDQRRMIRLHNPWGEREWNGPWSDGSKEWDMITEEQKKALGLVFHEDGEFWMEWGDFCKYFTDVSVCHVIKSADNYHKTTFFSEWKSGEEHQSNRAGGCPNFRATCLHNPQFCLTIPKTGAASPVLLHLHQGSSVDNDRLDGNETIGMQVLKVEENRKHRLHQYRGASHSVVSTSDFVNSRSIFLRLQNLKGGRYVVVPSTFFPHRERDFLLRIFTPFPSHPRELTKDLCNALAPSKKILRLLGMQERKPAIFSKILVQSAENLPQTDTYCEVKVKLNGSDSTFNSPVIRKSSQPNYNFALLLIQKEKITDIEIEILESGFLRSRSLGKIRNSSKVTNSMLQHKTPLKGPESMLFYSIGTFDNPSLV